jgi:hypothetical protein
MAFDKEAEANEIEHLIKLVFDSGRPASEAHLPMALSLNVVAAQC